MMDSDSDDNNKEINYDLREQTKVYILLKRISKQLNTKTSMSSNSNKISYLHSLKQDTLYLPPSSKNQSPLLLQEKVS